jgi:hypothetical protein
MMPVKRIAVVCVVAWASLCFAAELKVLMPLGRVAYQTNEWIDVSVVRSARDALAAGELKLVLSGQDGSKATILLPVGGAPAEGGDAKRTEHLHLNGWLLRPGRYSLDAACDGATASAELTVHSHIRKSSFRLIDWGCPAKKDEAARLGEDGMGFNLIYGSYGGHDQDANIRGGLDYMRNCTMGGAHQMDGRLECDWSDPYVLAGGMARSARQALADRTYPNVIGVHFYDEPGLTWHKHPKTGLFTGHDIPAQRRAYKAAFDQELPQYDEIKADDPDHAALWGRWLRWKQVFMEAAWRSGAFSVNWVRPDWLSATQSVYGWHAHGDGYYFNVVRCLPVISGHGGYDDYAGGYLNPGYFMEFGRLRDWSKPAWYLPTWWGMPSANYRLEQYLTFMINVQGLCKPPDHAIHAPGSKKGTPEDGIVETNKLMARLGTIFTTMPVNRSEVAVLYSMSQNVRAMLKSKDMMNFQDFPGQVERLELLYVASKMAHIPLFPLVEEDILDGTLAANHRAIVLTGIEELDPAVVRALEAYVAKGGRVILGDECAVKIADATTLGAAITDKIYVEAGKLFANKKDEDWRTKGLLARRPGVYFKEGKPIAAALTKRCQEIGVAPVADCDNPQVFVTRHALGDIEYLFLVNASCDESELTKAEHMNAIKAAEATVSLPDDGRPVYDAIWGGEATAFQKRRGKLTAELRFGPGQMRVYARTARKIGGVQVLPPVLPPFDSTLPRDPLRVEVMALLTGDVAEAARGLNKMDLDIYAKVIQGSAPMAVRLADPLGVVRYDLFRATDRGILKLSLPLAANDPAGKWTLAVRELLSHKEATATFELRPPAQCGALAGATHRAVYFGPDAQNVYRFFRTNKDVTLVTGKSDYNAAAAQRLATILKPWGVACKTVAAADVKPRKLDDDAKKTWTGLVGGGSMGFDIPGAAILLGTPEDNPLIKYLLDQRFLPYKPAKDAFPGRGRGYVAWQTDGIGFYNTESVTLIAYDAAGMAEAVGTLFEWASGYEPLTQWVLPPVAEIVAASKAPDAIPPAKVAWEATLPDSVVGLKVEGKTISVLTLDDTQTAVSADGKVGRQKVLSSRAAKALAEEATALRKTGPQDQKAFATPDRVVKFVAKGEGLTAVAYWGGLVKTFDARGQCKTQRMLPQDVGAIAWFGSQLIVGLADGKVVALALEN